MKEGRLISLGEGLASIPIELLQAQATGGILFIVGAGVSQNSGLPSFRNLVVKTYKNLDLAVYNHIQNLEDPRSFIPEEYPDLNPSQLAEVKAFINNEYDLTLGLLERRYFFESRLKTRVRSTVASILYDQKVKPSSLHEDIIKLSDRGTGLAVITTNFDVLLEEAAKKLKKPQRTYSLGEIMRPSFSPEFSGILHIHGTADPNDLAHELVLTDEDFGLYYLRGRSIPDFIYDAARLYSIVLIGYSANDPPMKYLLSAVSADYSRFTDIKPRYAFIGKESNDLIENASWKGRGIQPIHYDVIGNNHSALARTLAQWTKFVQSKDREIYFEKELLRIIKKTPHDTTLSNMDRFELIFYLSSAPTRKKLLTKISEEKSRFEWLDIALKVDSDGIEGVS